MKYILIIGSIVIPILMVMLQKKNLKFKICMDVLAILSALIFGNISSIAILSIIKDNTVFMTNIHGLFLNPIFLTSGAYLGVYYLFTLVLRVRNDFK